MTSRIDLAAIQITDQDVRFLWWRLMFSSVQIGLPILCNEETDLDRRDGRFHLFDKNPCQGTGSVEDGDVGINSGSSPLHILTSWRITSHLPSALMYE